MLPSLRLHAVEPCLVDFVVMALHLSSGHAVVSKAPEGASYHRHYIEKDVQQIRIKCF